MPLLSAGQAFSKGDRRTQDLKKTALPASEKMVAFLLRSPELCRSSKGKCGEGRSSCGDPKGWKGKHGISQWVWGGLGWPEAGSFFLSSMVFPFPEVPHAHLMTHAFD